MIMRKQSELIKTLRRVLSKRNKPSQKFAGSGLFGMEDLEVRTLLAADLGAVDVIEAVQAKVSDAEVCEQAPDVESGRVAYLPDATLDPVVEFDRVQTIEADRSWEVDVVFGDDGFDVLSQVAFNPQPEPPEDPLSSLSALAGRVTDSSEESEGPVVDLLSQVAFNPQPEPPIDVFAVWVR